MTVLAQPTEAAERRPTGGFTGDRRALLEHAAVLGAVSFIVLPFAHAGGGRDAGWAAVAALLVALAVILTRPWQRLSGLALVTAVGLTGWALVVLAATGVGRVGSVAALGYGLAAGLFVAVAGYARTEARRRAVAGLLCIGAVAQFGWALVPWWGGGDPAVPMVGTYYWHNQFAAALLAPALIGLGLVLDGRPIWRSLGLIAAPLSVAGVVFSTSRATMLALLGGWLAVVVVGWLGSTSRRRIAQRAVAVSLAAVALVVVLPGPPLFADRASPWQATEARAAGGETLTGNAVYRTEFWREALAVTAEHPVTGVGYGKLAASAGPLVPTDWARSSLAHSGVLQAFADGGVPLGLVTLLGLGLLALGFLRRVYRHGSSRSNRDPVVMAAAVAGLALLAHSLVDIDWSYPALAGVFGIVAGIALAGGRGSSGEAGGTNRVIASVLLVGLLLAGGALAWGEQFHINFGGVVQSMGGTR